MSSEQPRRASLNFSHREDTAKQVTDKWPHPRTDQRSAALVPATHTSKATEEVPQVDGHSVSTSPHCLDTGSLDTGATAFSTGG